MQVGCLAWLIHGASEYLSSYPIFPHQPEAMRAAAEALLEKCGVPDSRQEPWDCFGQALVTLLSEQPPKVVRCEVTSFTFLLDMTPSVVDQRAQKGLPLVPSTSLQQLVVAKGLPVPSIGKAGEKQWEAAVNDLELKLRRREICFACMKAWVERPACCTHMHRRKIPNRWVVYGVSTVVPAPQ